MDLMPMTDFVLQQHKESETNGQYIRTTFKYANFLKRPLTLGMFVPCDLEGNVLKNPNNQPNTSFTSEKHYENGQIETFYDEDYFNECLIEYQQAKERVLFKLEEGFDAEEILIELYSCIADTKEEELCTEDISRFTIEDLINIWHECDIELTESAIKQIQ